LPSSQSNARKTNVGDKKQARTRVWLEGRTEDDFEGLAANNAPQKEAGTERSFEYNETGWLFPSPKRKNLESSRPTPELCLVSSNPLPRILFCD
jgi:hypothetical protein